MKITNRWSAGLLCPMLAMYLSLGTALEAVPKGRIPEAHRTPQNRTPQIGLHALSSQVWAANSSTFAVLHAPAAAIPDFGKGSRKKSKAREEELARAAAVAEAQSRAAAASCVQVCAAWLQS